MPTALASSSIVTWLVGLSRKAARAASIKACSRWSTLVGVRRLVIADTAPAYQTSEKIDTCFFIFDTALTITDGASTLTYMSPGTRSVLPVACYVVLLVSALQTLVVPVIAAIPADLGVSTSSANWVVTANLLAAAVLTPVVGRLGDLYGR